MRLNLPTILLVIVVLAVIVVLLSSAGVDFDSILGVYHSECAGNCGAPWLGQ